MEGNKVENKEKKFVKKPHQHKTDKKPVAHKFKREIPYISQRDIDLIYDSAEKQISTVFDKCTLVCLKLKSGYILTASSACVSPENYSQEEGVKICEFKLKEQLWALEGYLLQNDVEIYNKNKGGNKNGKSNS